MGIRMKQIRPLPNAEGENEAETVVPEMKEETVILVPYAERLVEFWHKDTVTAQRSFPEFLKLIQAICLIHGKFRERHKGFLVANLDDYEIARRIAKIQKFKLGSGLQVAYRRIVDALRGKDSKYKHFLKDGSEVRGVTREQLSEMLERSIPQIDTYLETLCDMGIFRTHLRYIESETDIPLKLGRNPNIYSLMVKTEEDIIFVSPKRLLGVEESLLGYYFIPKKGDKWEIGKEGKIPVLAHPYDPLTGKALDLDGMQDIRMIEGRNEMVQAPLGVE